MAGLDQELGNVLPLIALQLNDFSKLLVLDNIPITTELFLQILEDLLVAELFLQPLHGGQALLSIPLLDADVNILFCPRGTSVLSSANGRTQLEARFPFNHVICWV
ncbi:uncharacterized protein J3R85_002264 [Psidium guajava]|nr:uncharacterized protein J3R85_002264 [Psidium guajava]